MTRRFEGRVAVVTGASSGIGLATATALACEGAHVVICARREEPLRAAVAEIYRAGGSAAFSVLDLADLDAFERLVRDTAQQHDRLDVLVNNAAVTRHGNIGDTDVETWRRNFSVIVDATFVGTRAALSVMCPQGSGSIVNVSSSCGSRAARGVSGYSAAKAAMNQFSQCAAMEAAEHNVRVNTVVPGSIVTPAMLAAAGGRSEVIERLEAAIPMQRSGRPEEVAAAIAFLASDEASFITGIELPVDGGKLAELYVPASLK